MRCVKTSWNVNGLCEYGLCDLRFRIASALSRIIVVRHYSRQHSHQSRYRVSSCIFSHALTSRGALVSSNLIEFSRFPIRFTATSQWWKFHDSVRRFWSLKYSRVPGNNDTVGTFLSPISVPASCPLHCMVTAIITFSIRYGWSRPWKRIPRSFQNVVAPWGRA